MDVIRMIECCEGSGYFEPSWVISKQQFLDLDIRDFVPIHKLSLIEILKLPLGSIVYAKYTENAISPEDILVIKSCHKFFYYRDFDPPTCYTDFNGYWGGFHNLKEYDYYLTKRKIKGLI